MVINRESGSPETASELNNLLQIISGTSALLENIWEGNAGSEKYFSMLRASVQRAEEIAAQLVAQAGGSPQKVLIHPDLAAGAKKPTPNPTLSPKQRILVVDDERMALALSDQILSDANFEVVTTASGFECLDLFRGRPGNFDLVLLDLSMPFMDGDEVFRRLRSISPALPVVLTTGFIDDEKLQSLLREGLSGLMRKPYSAEDLVTYVRSLLESVRGARADDSLRGIAAAV